ncbi:MAG TPA: GTPase HflX [Balneolaceae bacterium]|nr:GTPase HflX [Balneolaceae bacterium]
MLNDLQHNNIQQEQVLLVGLYGPDLSRYEAEEHIDELALLTDTAGGKVVDKVLQNRTTPDASYYIGEGKLREISSLAKALNIDTLIFDDDLSPTQSLNIEKAAETKVLDRSGLILDIFASRAKTAAAKAQVELAQLKYMRPRLSRFWTHLSRQQGGIGTRGPGEQQIETDRRLIDKRIDTLKQKLDKLDRQRKTQRKRRSNMNTVSLVGYTNAGKSTLMNALTETNVHAEDRLFATLDATIRRYSIDNYDMLLSDTVGFIRKLPHHLIESFKSTLDELREADILLHIIDSSSNMLSDYIEVVEHTLNDLNISNEKQLKIFNKIDIIETNRLVELKRAYPAAVFVSAERGIGLNKLNQKIKKLAEKDFITRTMLIPASKYEGVAFLHRVANIHNQNYVGSDIEVTFSISEENLQRLKSLLSELEMKQEPVNK